MSRAGASARIEEVIDKAQIRSAISLKFCGRNAQEFVERISSFYELHEGKRLELEDSEIIELERVWEVSRDEFDLLKEIEGGARDPPPGEHLTRTGLDKPSEGEKKYSGGVELSSLKDSISRSLMVKMEHRELLVKSGAREVQGPLKKWSEEGLDRENGKDSPPCRCGPEDERPES